MSLQIYYYIIIITTKINNKDSYIAKCILISMSSQIEVKFTTFTMRSIAGNEKSYSNIIDIISTSFNKD